VSAAGFVNVANFSVANAEVVVAIGWLD
jgi:hypothetical protein